jgi:hypothetical protein
VTTDAVVMSLNVNRSSITPWPGRCAKLRRLLDTDECPRPSVLMVQECMPDQFADLKAKLGMQGLADSDQNAVLWDPLHWWREDYARRDIVDGRAVVAVYLRHRFGTGAWFASSHLSPGGDPAEHAMRKRQTVDLLDFLADVHTHHDQVSPNPWPVLGTDMNNHLPYEGGPRWLMAQAGWLGVRDFGIEVVNGHLGTFESYHQPEDDGQWLDELWMRDTAPLWARLVDTQALGITDHRGILASLTF